MKLTIVFILLATLVNAQEIKTAYWKNGCKKSEGIYIDTVMDGHWTFWYENGKKWSEGNYNKGQKLGTWRVWYDSGAKWKVSSIDEGTAQGTPHHRHRMPGHDRKRVERDTGLCARSQGLRQTHPGFPEHPVQACRMQDRGDHRPYFRR